MARLTTVGNNKHPNPFPRDWRLTALWAVVAIYLVYSVDAMGLNFTRFIEGLSHADKLLSRMFPPDFSRWQLLLDGLLESLEIAVISCVIGVFLSLFIGLFAKLFAEAIEEISFKQVEAIQATGASFISVILFSAFQRFDYDFVAAILITIIALILFWEFLSTVVLMIF